MNLCCADCDQFTTASTGLRCEPSRDADSRLEN